MLPVSDTDLPSILGCNVDAVGIKFTHVRSVYVFYGSYDCRKRHAGAISAECDFVWHRDGKGQGDRLSPAGKYQRGHRIAVAVCTRLYATGCRQFHYLATLGDRIGCDDTRGHGTWYDREPNQLPQEIDVRPDHVFYCIYRRPGGLRYWRDGVTSLTSPAPERFTVDIAIIGGGVAGASAAIVLQRAGYSTAVIEREAVFRDRVRGEACHPWGVRELIELGLKPFVDVVGGLELPTWTRYRDRQTESTFEWAEVFPGSPPEIGFNHPKLQDALLRGARDAGSRVFRPAQADVARTRDSWLLQVQQEDQLSTLHSRFLIAADGKNSATRRLWGGRTLSDPPHHQFGGLLVRDVALPRDSAHQAFHAAGFTMMFPQGDDFWRLYYVCPTETAREFTGENRIRNYIEACAACLPEGVLTKAIPEGPLAFFPNNHVATSRIDGPNAVAIGDAAGAGDPSQGHGMSLVWRDVRVLRDVLLSHGLADAPEAFAKKRRAYEHVLRTHAAWVAPLTTGTSDLAIALQTQVDDARAEDATALGYAGIFAHGPDHLPTDEASRALFFGENLTSSPIRIETPLDKIE